VTLCGKAGLEEIEAICIVDCTGDANVVSLAGGMLRAAGDDLQPGTQTCIAGGYDMESLDLDRINHAFAAAAERGEVCAHDIGWDGRAANVGSWLRKRGHNANHIPGIDASDSWGRTRMELAGRA
jgi:hypothetical protein